MAAFGRRVEFDERSRGFPAVAALRPTQQTPRSYTWRNPLRLDQGNLGSCVGNAWTHEAAANPYPVPGLSEKIAVKVYRRAQQLDQWPETPPEEGTSVLAGAKAAMEMTWLKQYRWAFGLDDLILSVGHLGPAVLGINWYDGMMETDAKGYVHPTGEIVGGHAILCNRVNLRERFFGLSNSWGTSWGSKDAWGVGGTCRIGFAAMGKLLDEDGEACIPLRRGMPGL